MLAVILGLAVLVFIAGRVFGGVLLRALALSLLVLGAVGLVVTQDAAAALVPAIGVVMWLAGHWHARVCLATRAAPLPTGAPEAARSNATVECSSKRARSWRRASVSVAILGAWQRQKTYTISIGTLDASRER